MAIDGDVDGRCAGSVIRIVQGVGKDIVQCLTCLERVHGGAVVVQGVDIATVSTHHQRTVQTSYHRTTAGTGGVCCNGGRRNCRSTTNIRQPQFSHEVVGVAIRRDRVGRTNAFDGIALHRIGQTVFQNGIGVIHRHWGIVGRYHGNRTREHRRYQRIRATRIHRTRASRSGLHVVAVIQHHGVIARGMGSMCGGVIAGIFVLDGFQQRFHFSDRGIVVKRDRQRSTCRSASHGHAIGQCTAYLQHIPVNAIQQCHGQHTCAKGSGIQDSG